MILKHKISREDFNLTINAYDAILNEELLSPWKDNSWLQHQKDMILHYAILPREDGPVHITITELEAQDFYFLNGYAFALAVMGEFSIKHDYIADLQKKQEDYEQSFKGANPRNRKALEKVEDGSNV